MLRVAVVERLAVDDVTLSHGETGAVEHAQLLRLAVVDGRLSAECVQMVSGERLLRHWRGGGRVGHLRVHLHRAREDLTDAIEITGDELQLRLPE